MKGSLRSLMDRSIENNEHTLPTSDDDWHNLGCDSFGTILRGRANIANHLP
jgi:hypothetical protein